MRVAVTGATGYVGRFIVGDLLEHSMEVRALARPSSDRGGFGGPVEWIEGDLRWPEALAALVEGMDAVVHAGFEHLPGRYRGGEGEDLEGFLAANLGGSLTLMRLAKAAGVRRFVFLSSRAVYARSLPRRALDEGHPAWPDTHYGACKAAVEAFLGVWGPDFEACAIRPTGVYGLTRPAPRSKWFDLVARIARGQPWTQARGGTEVHGVDVARAVRLLLRAPGVAGQAYNCSDLYVTGREVAEIVQRLTGAGGPLPDRPATPPANVMETGRLRGLGFEFGGRPLLERTVAELVEAVGRDRP